MVAQGADGNNRDAFGIESGVRITSRWFPAVLAILQTVSYLALISSLYVEEFVYNPRILGRYLQDDISRPFFAESQCCQGDPPDVADLCEGSGPPGYRTALIFNFPAYFLAALLHAAIRRGPFCFDALTTVRGQLFLAPFIWFLWFLVGVTLRRRAQRGWRHPTALRRSKLLAPLALSALPCGIVALIALTHHVYLVGYLPIVGFAGFAFWYLYFEVLMTERFARRKVKAAS